MEESQKGTRRLKFPDGKNPVERRTRRLKFPDEKNPVERTKRDRTQGNFWSLNQQQILVLLPPFVFVLNGEDWAETQTKKKNWGNWTEKKKKNGS